MAEIKPLDEIEMFELLQACYPDKFPDEEDKTVEAADEFIGEMGDWDGIADLLGRVATLTMPIRSPLTGTLHHALGAVSVDEENNAANMTAAVKRNVV